MKVVDNTTIHGAHKAIVIDLTFLDYINQFGFHIMHHTYQNEIRMNK